MKERDTYKYILIIISGVLWGTIGLFVKLLTAEGSSPAYTTFMRMFFAFLGPFLELLKLMYDDILHAAGFHFNVT